MARKKDQQAVTAKMYRHFAVVTLIATAALAMAADDGNADQLNAQLAAQEAAIAAKGKEIKQKNQATVIKRSSGKPAPAASGWGSDEGGDSGFAGGGSSASMPADYGAAAVTDAMLRQLRMTRSQFMALPPRARHQLLNQLSGSSEPYVAPAVAARRQEAAVSASLARSGFDGACQDC